MVFATTLWFEGETKGTNPNKGIGERTIEYIPDPE